MITVKEMIVGNDFSKITHDSQISMADFIRLTDCKYGIYGQYSITESGVTSKDFGNAFDMVSTDDVLVLSDFKKSAELSFPTTAANLVQWVEQQNGEFPLPDKFDIAVTASTQLIGNAKYPRTRQSHQEHEILRVLKELGYIATALPVAKSGNAGVKAEVRAKLDFPVKVFDKAWERLRANKEIQDQQATLPPIGV